VIVNRIASLFFVASIALLTSLGCGNEETAVPVQTAADQQKMDEYYKKIEEAEAKGIDPTTIPAP